MQLGQLSETALYASDLAAARHFYQDVLGLELISEMEGRLISAAALVRLVSLWSVALGNFSVNGNSFHVDYEEGDGSDVTLKWCRNQFNSSVERRKDIRRV